MLWHAGLGSRGRLRRRGSANKVMRMMRGEAPAMARARAYRPIGGTGRFRPIAVLVVLALCVAACGCGAAPGPDEDSSPDSIANLGSSGSTTQESSEPDETVDLFPAQSGGLYGLIDKTGEFVVDPQYEWIGDYAEGLAPVVHNGYDDGFIDRFGRIVIKVPNGDVESFSEGLALFWGDHTCGYIDKTGAIVIEPQYVWAGEFHEGLAAVQTDWSGQGCGFIDQTGRFVIEPRFHDANDFAEGLAPAEVFVQGKSMWGFIDRTGEFVIEPQFDFAFSFGDGLAPVEENGKWGFIDRTGQFVIPPQYGSASVFSEGLAGVAVGMVGIDALICDVPEGKWGFIDVTGRFVIEPQFTASHRFRGGLALVATVEGNWEYIDAAGTVVCSWPADSFP